MPGPLVVVYVLVPVFGALVSARYDAMGRYQRATVTDLRSDRLLEEVRQALRAEGCYAAIEIVKLLGAAPGQRIWEIATIGPNTAAPDVRRCIIDVQTRLGEKFHYGYGGDEVGAGSASTKPETIGLSH